MQNLSIFDDREIVWLFELAAATGMSRDLFDKLIATGDLIAIDMSASNAKRRKMAVHRDSWNAFLRERTTSNVHSKQSKSKQRKQQQVTDYLKKGKRKLQI